jgi:hypothetical protein
LDHPIVTTDFGAWDRVVVTVIRNGTAEFIMGTKSSIVESHK